MTNDASSQIQPQNKYIVWLDNAKILSIFAVVIGHVTSTLMAINEIGSTNWWYGHVFRSMINWCVPVFVMVSGALLLDPKKKEDYATFYKKRFSKIFIPLVFWTVIYTLLVLKTGYYGDYIIPTTHELIRHLLTGTPYYHMWFLYMIIGLYLFTPFFRKIVENTTRRELILLVMISLLFAMLSTGYSILINGTDKRVLFTNQFLPFIPYFFTGYLINTSEFKPKKPALWIVSIVSFIISFLGCYYFMYTRGINSGEYFNESLSFAVVPMSISIMVLLKSWRKPIINNQFTKKLASLTLGIYLIHPLFFLGILMLIHGLNSLHPLLSISLITLVTYFISLLAVWGISKVPILNRIQ